MVRRTRWRAAAGPEPTGTLAFPVRQPYNQGADAGVLPAAEKRPEKTRQ
jgi:hypothetical protein